MVLMKTFGSGLGVPKRLAGNGWVNLWKNSQFRHAKRGVGREEYVSTNLRVSLSQWNSMRAGCVSISILADVEMYKSQFEKFVVVKKQAGRDKRFRDRLLIQI